jgi:hypothetical protein
MWEDGAGKRLALWGIVLTQRAQRRKGAEKVFSVQSFGVKEGRGEIPKLKCARPKLGDCCHQAGRCRAATEKAELWRDRILGIGVLMFL